MIVACSAPPECFALSGRGTYPDRNTTLFRSNRPIQNRRTPWMLLTDAFTIFPHRRKDGLEKQRTRWGEEEPSWNVMYPYQSGKGSPRARRNQKQAPARHPIRRSRAIPQRPRLRLGTHCPPPSLVSRVLLWSGIAEPRRLVGPFLPVRGLASSFKPSLVFRARMDRSACPTPSQNRS